MTSSKDGIQQGPGGQIQVKDDLPPGEMVEGGQSARHWAELTAFLYNSS